MIHYQQKYKSRAGYVKLEYGRYADHFILFLDSNLEGAKHFKEKLSTFPAKDWNLQLNESKTKIS
jgi:hypothetical protein